MRSASAAAAPCRCRRRENARPVTCSKVTNMSEKGKKASEFINRLKIRTTRIEPSAAAAAERQNAVRRARGPAPEPLEIQ
ncbi:hypothetical protein GNZ24_25975 [Burkholderia thailandensis]|nr:hypothetical protein A8H31_10430 [Burkholderia thailandensis]AVR27461.1 hypothetical protein A8H32_20610 [Burkholderia thailandensis]AWY60827.1 hypothetical protein A8H35_21125 [Burkholderia thailandensis]AWY64880.1 hypothetical protein A8H36_06175 [Burkholderia thailandensis]MDD1482367.1 hypothetical protein [Burkholderia thailandensis]